jgi:hypothetical protein
VSTHFVKFCNDFVTIKKSSRASKLAGAFQTYDSYTILAMLPARIHFAAARWTAVAVSDQEACGLL